MIAFEGVSRPQLRLRQGGERGKTDPELAEIGVRAVFGRLPLKIDDLPMPDPQAGGCQSPFHDPSNQNYGGPHAVRYAAADINGGKMNTDHEAAFVFAGRLAGVAPASRSGLGFGSITAALRFWKTCSYRG